MTGELRVDPAAVAAAGEGLGQAAGQIPSPPAGFVAINSGDPLSAAAWAYQQKAEVPILEGLPVVKVDAAATAAKTVRAAGTYQTTDADLGARLHGIQCGER